MYKILKNNLYLIILIFLIIQSLSINYYFNSGLKQLPGTMYSGDYYYQMGAIEHISQGGEFMQSSSLTNSLPTYFPLYSKLVSITSKIFNLDSFKAMILFSYLILIIQYILWFILFKIVFKKETIALIGTFLINDIGNLIIKYTDFSYKIILPIYLILLFKTFKTNKLRYWFSLGLIIGISSISHMILFIGEILITFNLFLFKYILEIKNKNKIKKLIKIIKTNYLNWTIFLTILIPISLIYWFKPIFIFHLETIFDRSKFDFMDLSNIKYQFIFIYETITHNIINFTNVKNIFISIFSIIGIYLIKKDKNKKYIILLGISILITIFSYFITENIFHMNLIPLYLKDFFLTPLQIFFVLITINYLFKNKKIKKYSLIIIIFFILIISIISFTKLNNQIENNYWYNHSKEPIDNSLIEISNYIKNNSNINDIIITNKEIGFSINALTGRKLITGSWAQNADPFTDLSQRDLELALILYSNNSKIRENLILKYKPKFLYWNNNWNNLEFIRNNKNEIEYIFDPLIIFNTKKNKEILISNNIKFFETKYWVTPVVRRKEIKQFDLLMINPENYHSFEEPWNSDLNKYLVLKKNIKNKENYHKLYEFKK